MSEGKRYTVSTHWGWFSLDERSYQDYLQGKLWISWTPGKNVPRPSVDAPPPDVSREAVAIRDEAAKDGAWETFHGRFSEMDLSFPYEDHLKDISIGELSLSVRSSNALMRAGIDTFGKLYSRIRSDGGLSSIRNLGVKSEKEIKAVFFSECYGRLQAYEKSVYWQNMIDQAYER